MNNDRYPKRLIEVDLPIARISTHARREKSIRHGHISTLHIWWARRPLAACRAVMCAALWPDPADPLCPQVFREMARAQMGLWTDRLGMLSPESYSRFVRIQKAPGKLDDDEELRNALLIEPERVEVEPGETVAFKGSIFQWFIGYAINT